MTVAFIESQDGVLFARADSTHAPESAITRLIQGVYELYPEHARAHLRRPIFTNSEPTEMCWGMLKVSAKRLRVVSSIPEFPENAVDLNHVAERLLKSAANRLIAPREKFNKDWMTLAQSLVASVGESPRYLRDRPVSAVLVSAQNELLAAAANTNSRNRTLHAEINLVQGYYAREGKLPPAGTRVYTTLKPCKMCAGMIWNCLPGAQVFFGAFDPGPNGRNTVLDRGTFERRRASAGNHELLELELQHPSVDGSSDSGLVGVR